MKHQLLSGLIAAALAGLTSTASAQDVLPDVRLLGEPIVISQPRAVTSVDTDPDGARLLSTGLDGTVRLWSLAQGTPDGVFQAHAGDAANARFTRDGQSILSTGADGRAVLVDAATGRVKQTWQFPTWCLGLAITSADRAAVGCADLKIRIINLETGHTERELQAPGNLQYGYVTSMASSRDGKLLVSNNPATVFDLDTGEQIISKPSFLRSMVFSPDGQSLLGGNLATNAEIWEVSNLTPRRGVLTDVETTAQTPSGPRTVQFRMPVYSVAWSPDGRYFATGGLDRLVRIFRFEGYERPTALLQFEGHESTISTLAWHGDRVISGDLGGHIRIWTLGIDPEN